MLRHDRLVELAREHHNALRLAVHLRRGGDVATLRARVDEERAELERHFDEEEGWLQQELRALGEHAFAQRMCDDHVQLRELMNSARDEASLKTLGELLHTHVRFEDRELFPCLEAHWQEAP